MRVGQHLVGAAHRRGHRLRGVEAREQIGLVEARDGGLQRGVEGIQAAALVLLPVAIAVSRKRGSPGISGTPRPRQSRSNTDGDAPESAIHLPSRVR